MIAVFLILGLVGFAVVKSKRQGAVDTIASGRALPAPRVDAYRARLIVIRELARAGKPVPSALVDDVVTMAYERGDWRVVSALSKGSQMESGTVRVEESEEIDESNLPPLDASKPLIASPIDGASDDEWAEFVDQLRTEEVSYATDKHVGAYHQNRERLSRLGIEPASLTSDESQRDAVSRDMAAYREAERKLIDDFGGDLVMIDGKEHPVTMSGVLGVLKAAGPKHARSWFKNPEDREAFTHTTETFLRTNNIF